MVEIALILSNNSHRIILAKVRCRPDNPPFLRSGRTSKLGVRSTTTILDHLKSRSISLHDIHLLFKYFAGTFKRGRAGQSIVYQNQDVLISGHLQHYTYHPVLNISMLPSSTKNLAPSILHQLYPQTEHEAGRNWSQIASMVLHPVVELLNGLKSILKSYL